MLLAVMLSNAIFASFFLILCIINKSEATCDINWVRMMYMNSCGKKKRDSALMTSESFSSSLPTDVYGALKYLRERDRARVAFGVDGNNEILDEDELKYPRDKTRYGKFNIRFNSRHPKKMSDTKLLPKSVLMKKLFNAAEQDSYLGIQGFPDEWDVHELLEQKANENYRREIDRLLEECCKPAHESRCNGATFRGSCK